MLVTVAGIASFVLAAVFAWAAATKLLRVGAWRDALRGYGLGARAESVALGATPAAEALTALLLAAGRTRLGGALSLLLVSTFSLAILRARARSGGKLPCGCFGGTGLSDHRVLLARNALLATLAAVVLLGGRSLARPAGIAPLPVALALVGVGLAAWVLVGAAAPLRRRGDG
jgi:hypothetical protein